MKICIVGNWRFEQYEPAFARALESLGHQVVEFSVTPFFTGPIGIVQQVIPFPGAAFLRLNKKLLNFVRQEKPDLTIFWRSTHILPNTIIKIKDLGVVTISYNNDDPFGPQAHGNVPWHHHFLWWWYLRCLQHFNFNFFYRKINCEEAKSYGAKHADVLLPYFLPWNDKPISLDINEKNIFKADVVFVGHYEADGRLGHLRALLDAGINVKLWGGHYWSPKNMGDLYKSLAPIVPVEGVDYRKALSGANICLCFLSKLNRDTYTRRCFEIPACGKVMLAERTDDLLNMFKEDEEACFFSSSAELVKKTKWLLNNPELRLKIAKAGFNRVWSDGHDVNNRASWFLKAISTDN